MSAWEFTGSEADPEHRFHRPIRPMGFRNVAPDPQEEPAFTGCWDCMQEDCPGADVLVDCPTAPRRSYRPPVRTGWGQVPEDGMEPDRAEERIEDARERWAS